MQKYKVKIDGMTCGMCEAHINDLIRRIVPGSKKVSSSHKDKIATFLADEVDEDKLIQAIAETGYTALEIEHETYEKKGFFFHL